MLIPKDENFEEIQKQNAVKSKVTMNESSEIKKNNVRIQQIRSPSQGTSFGKNLFKDPSSTVKKTGSKKANV